MLVELSKVIFYEGYTIQQESKLDLTDITVQGEKFPVLAPDPVKLKIVNSGDSVLAIQVQGKVSAVIPCSRCLEDVKYDFPLSIERSVDMKLSAEEMEESEEEYNFIEKGHLNVDQLVKNELLINWPIRVLCKKDCKGICSRCGANLNLGDCGCDREELDPRMAAVKDIFSKFKEV